MNTKQKVIVGVVQILLIILISNFTFTLFDLFGNNDNREMLPERFRGLTIKEMNSIEYYEFLLKENIVENIWTDRKDFKISLIEDTIIFGDISNFKIDKIELKGL